MKILGLQLGALSTAALLVDGEIVACASEERFSRTKNDESYPKQAIEYCLAAAGVSPGDLDHVAVSSLKADLWHRLTHYYSRFSIDDYVREQTAFWYPTLYEDKKLQWHKMYEDRWDLDQYPGRARWEAILRKVGDSYYLDAQGEQVVNDFIASTIEHHLGFSADRVRFVEHHAGHAAYAQWASPADDRRTCVITIDAYGDGLSATIAIADGTSMKRYKAIDHRDFQLARMYRYTTLLLGMKPNEHEYKVMGLAAYAKPDVYKRAYDVYRNTMYVDGLDFRYHDRPKDNYFYFRDRLEGCRFDGIAGGLQKYLEEILAEWVGNAMRETGTRRVVLSGGVAMNVKAMKYITALPEVDDLFVPPSGGDESQAIGVCYELCHSLYDTRPSAMRNAYLGEDVGAADVRDVVTAIRAGDKPYDITANVSVAQVARQIASGRIVARCAGRMEFGARALGNRSIVADPRRAETVRILNAKIKNRDFWMPFAPAILSERADSYIENAKRLSAPYMTVAFDTTADGARDLVAGSHQADLTVRPQLVDDRTNPEFAQLIRAFETNTGIGAVLNTSFNLHGEPIVRTPADALRVFELTELDDLIIGDTLVSKRAAPDAPQPS